jgi:hypothetical protein
MKEGLSTGNALLWLIRQHPLEQVQKLLVKRVSLLHKDVLKHQ